MARRKGHSPYPSAQLSVEQMKAALPRLKRRISDLRAFEPADVTTRDDPRIKSLGDAVDDFLTRTFGGGTIEYNRYVSATNLDTAGLRVGRSTPLNEVIQGLQYGKDRAIEKLEGIGRIFEEEIDLEGPEAADRSTQSVQSKSNSRKVFIVHGRDHGIRDRVARFLEKLDLSPVVLDEVASKGRTIHQKLRENSTVAFAVELFTPDDKGGPADDSSPLKPRARQNVVYELGFFSASLGDSRVCVLYSDGVEIPSDLNGVLYVLLDEHGAWRTNLAREISAAEIEINMNVFLLDDI